jgi:hypothetical protein
LSYDNKQQFKMKFEVRICVLSSVVLQVACYYGGFATLGDSVAEAINCVGLPDLVPGVSPRSTPFLNASWATGTDSTRAYSFLQRLRDTQDRELTAVNHAAFGSKSIDMNAQAALLDNANDLDLVIMSVGTNDLCNAQILVPNPTPVEDFSNNILAAVTTIRLKAPNAKLIITSIANVVTLYETFKGLTIPSLSLNPYPPQVWAFGGICPLVLLSGENPQGIAARAQALIISASYNTALSTICAADKDCYFTDALYRGALEIADVDTYDFFHPSCPLQESPDYTGADTPQIGQSKVAERIFSDVESFLFETTDAPTVEPTTEPEPTVTPTVKPKCLWDTGCMQQGCEAGSYCKVYQWWSQCVENAYSADTDDCFSTVNGPWRGIERWGCETDSDCCNAAAVCSANRLCELSCRAQQSSSESGAGVDGEKNSNEDIGMSRWTVVWLVGVLGLGLGCIMIAFAFACKGKGKGIETEAETSIDSDVVEIEHYGVTV